MPIFGISQERESLNRLSGLIKRAKMLYEKSEDRDLLSYLDKLENHSELSVIKPFGLAVNCIEMIMNNSVNYNINNYYKAVKYAEDVYKSIFIYDEQTPDFEDLRIVYTELFEDNGIIPLGLFDSDLFNSFKNKYNYITFMNSAMQKGDIHVCIYDLSRYGKEVREYYIDDLEYTYNLINVAEKIIPLSRAMWADIFAEEKLKVQRMSGIYNLDATDVAKASDELDTVRRIMAQGNELVIQTESQIKQLGMLKEQTSKAISEDCDIALVRLGNKCEEYSLSLDKAFEDFLAIQKEKLNFERHEFVESMFDEAKAELEKLKVLAGNISQTTALELARVNQRAEDTVKKIEKMVNDDVQVQKVLKQTAQNQEFIDRINKLSVLNDANLKPAPAKGSDAVASVIVKEAPGAASYDEEVDTEVSYEVNPFLDKSIPFSKRFDTLMKAKKNRMDAGEHFHKMFDDVLTAILEDANPYLIGPSGCGKTFMIRQISELMQLAFVDIGYINEEYEILGFQTANGGFSRPNFYRCYKYGKIAFCDELDNGNSRATVKLNSFLTGGADASYSFPNGENVKRHPNFRIVGAGNTAGNGADVNYNTREKIEESVQQRFMPIYIDYDNAVEEKILKDYPEWYDFIVLFRRATDAWAADILSEAAGIITTRDAAKIKKYLDNKSFSMQKIITYEFIQTKEIEYLLFLDEHMRNSFSQNNKSLKCKKQVDEFHAQVTALRGKKR